MTVRPTASAVLTTWSSVGLTNTPTISTRRLSAAAISVATAGSQRRSDRGQKFNPIAQAPAATADWASARVVIPQNLIFGVVTPHIVRRGLWHIRVQYGALSATGLGGGARGGPSEPSADPLEQPFG